MAPCTCDPTELCERCYGRELAVKARQADVIGQCWAERAARHQEHRGRASWPSGERALAIAERLVEHLAADPRLRAELAKACVAGAGAWWERRPTGYRAWSLVTAPDERERCCVVDGARCPAAAAFEVAGPGGELDDRTWVCADHLELVRQPGDRVTALYPAGSP